ncbi:hypothetical protein MTBLM5_650002 [Magnetospirillum sp. LM-5]|nr:hypothetical protein MTBLM5_650002 [Magnetospirillum sp. LM-5]
MASYDGTVGVAGRHELCGSPVNRRNPPFLSGHISLPRFSVPLLLRPDRLGDVDGCTQIL